MTWRSALGEGRNDIREMISEFHYLPDFLTNSNMFVFSEWWSEWEYLIDQFPSTAILLNTWLMEFSYLADYVILILCIYIQFNN